MRLEETRKGRYAQRQLHIGRLIKRESDFGCRPVGQHRNHVSDGKGILDDEARQQGDALTLQDQSGQKIAVVGADVSLRLVAAPLPAIGQLPDLIAQVVATAQTGVIVQILGALGDAARAGIPIWCHEQLRTHLADFMAA